MRALAEGGLRADELGAGLVQLRLGRTGVDREEQLAAADIVAVAEMDGPADSRRRAA